MSITQGLEAPSEALVRRLAYARSVKAASAFAGRSEFDGAPSGGVAPTKPNAREERTPVKPTGARTYVPSHLRLNDVSDRRLVTRSATKRLYGREAEVHSLPIPRVPAPQHGARTMAEAWLEPVVEVQGRAKRPSRPSTPPARRTRARASAVVTVINPVRLG